MHHIILCGGNGTRMLNYSFPKPLNMIYGKPALWYSISKFPKEVDTLYIIYNSHLEEYNFEETVRNMCKDRHFIFVKIDYFTRGPIETAFVGLQSLNIPVNEPIVFFDNDTIHEFPSTWGQHDLETAFLGYSIDTTNSSSFSFIQQNDGMLTNIVEKERISNQYCVGVYGFANSVQFNAAAKEILSIPSNREYYMSFLCNSLLAKKESISTVLFAKSLHVGSLTELQTNLGGIPVPHMRICFDLDNTICTYPNIPGDYRSVKPIKTMVELMRTLKKQGHTIIIHTARRMATHGNNIGKVIRDIGKITLDWLEENNIEYDEIIFGKPIADVYIDDRAINPYRNDWYSMGMFQYKDIIPVLNKLPNNKYNEIEGRENTIIKKGPIQTIRHEAEYYLALEKHMHLKQFFPRMETYTEENGFGKLELEHVKGIPYTTLLKHNLLCKTHIELAFSFLDLLHHYQFTPVPSETLTIQNYVNKLEDRMKDKEIYCFDNIGQVSEIIFQRLRNYTISGKIHIVPWIHGDFWFSNMMLRFNNTFCCFDMRGNLYGQATTGGDANYDYAKFLQSILGYDATLYGHAYAPETRKQLIDMFKEQIYKRSLDYQTIFDISVALMMGSIPAIESETKRKHMWEFIVSLL